MSAANDAAAGLTGELVAELVDKVPPADAEYDQLGQEIAALRQEQPVEAAIEPSSEVASVAQEEVQETELPNYDREIPEDILELISAPDFDAEALAEVPDDEEEIGYDEQDTDERRQRIAAEKKVAWLEGRLQEQSRSKWEAEATKYFPLSQHVLKDINANSRRAFLKEAKKAHESILPYVQPLIEQLGSTTDQARAQAKQEGRDQAQAAWGTPTTGPGVVPVTSSAATAELEAARKTGNLSKIISVLMKQGQ
jgi:hypothetical protein